MKLIHGLLLMVFSAATTSMAADVFGTCYFYTDTECAEGASGPMAITKYCSAFANGFAAYKCYGSNIKMCTNKACTACSAASSSCTAVGGNEAALSG